MRRSRLRAGMFGVAVMFFVARPAPADARRVEGTSFTLGLAAKHENAFEPFSEGKWVEGTDHGGWSVAFDGYGAARVVTTTSGRALEEAPMAPRGAADTHAVLVRGTDTFADLDVRVTMRTIAQLRSRANPWETAWFVWHYIDNDHFYYVILKPNGWELGKRDPAYRGGQRFLATGTTPTYPIGAAHTVRVQQSAGTMTVSADDRSLVTFTDRERPYTQGSLALYTEDAVVRFEDVVTSSLPVSASLNGSTTTASRRDRSRATRPPTGR